MRKFLISLVLMVLSTNRALGQNSDAMIVSLNGLEQHYFLHPYPADAMSARLDRIEKLVLGEAQTGSDKERFQRLKNIISDIGLYSTPSSPSEVTPPKKIALQGGVAAVDTAQSKMLEGGTVYDETPQMIIAWDKWHRDFASAVHRWFEKGMQREEHYAKGADSYETAMRQSGYQGKLIPNETKWVHSPQEADFDITVTSEPVLVTGGARVSDYLSIKYLSRMDYKHNFPEWSFGHACSLALYQMSKASQLGIVESSSKRNGTDTKVVDQFSCRELEYRQPFRLNDKQRLWTHESLVPVKNMVSPDMEIPPFPAGSQRKQVQVIRKFRWNMGTPGFGWVKGDVETVFKP